MRQLRCTRRELVKMKHDERFRKGDAGDMLAESLASSPKSSVWLLISRGKSLAPLLGTMGQCGNFPRGGEKVSTATRGAALDGPTRCCPGVDRHTGVSGHGH